MQNSLRIKAGENNISGSLSKSKRPFRWRIALLSWLSLYIIICLTACASEQVNTASSTTSIPSRAFTTKAPTVAPSTLAPTPMSEVTKAAPPQDWQSRWLKGIPCKPPCFEGITPGKTTAEEAATILRQKVFPGNYSTKSGSLIVSRVTPGFDKGVAFTLGDIIKAYGEPSLISGEYRPPHNQAIGLNYSIRVIYLVQGIALFHTDYNSKPVIDANYSLDYVFFFAPGLDGFYDAYGTPEQVGYKLVPWQGYNTFNFYCTMSYDVFKDCSNA